MITENSRSTTNKLCLLLAIVTATACSSSSAGSGSSSSGGPSGSSSGGPTCGSNQVICGSACADLQDDPANCGACGMACGKGQACASGACVVTCTGANGTVCNGDCVDLSSDQANCGSCSHACTAGQSCVSGVCQVAACTAPLSSCGGGELSSCTNLQTDPQNCGSCGNVCDAGHCDTGECQPCASGQTLCGSSCTNTQTDGENCGSCGHSCGTGVSCSGGACPSSCEAGQTSCAGSCVDTQTNGENCGGCADAGGQVCTSAQSCQVGACVDVCAADAGLSACGSGSSLVCANLGTDPDNCGSCGHGCGTGLGCDGGLCNCPTGTSLCGTGSSAACIDTGDDPQNCGACGHVCSSQLCHQGNCLFCAAGSFGFGPLVLVDAGASPGYVGVAKFTGNGGPDLAAANSGDGTLGLLLNKDVGFAPQLTFNADLDTPILSIGDLNGDGRPDVATLTAGDDSFSVLLNQTPDGGAVTFNVQGPFICTATEMPATLEIADVNGDGLPDVVVGGTGLTLTPPFLGGTLDVFVQTDAGFPSTSTSSLLVGDSVAALATVRLGGDGGLAVVTVDNSAGAVFVLPAPGLSPQTSYPVGNGPVSIAVGDLNGDGIADLAVLNQSDETVTVLAGQPGGTFTAVGSAFTVLATSGLAGATLVPEWVTVGDVNGDGILDLIVSVSDALSLGGDTVNYFINQGNATFAAPVAVPAAATGFSPLSVVLHDLNGDGLPDLALGNLGSGDFVGVLYGQCP